MNRTDFIAFVEATLEKAIRHAENYSGRSLPRQLSFHWLDDTRRPIREGIAEAITAQVFVDENHIYPCVEIAVTDLLDDGTLEIAGRIPQVSATWANGFKPRSLAKSWTGSVGPFVLVIAQRLLDRLKGVESNTPVWIYFYDSSPK